jgi:hypothetical protein
MSNIGAISFDVCWIAEGNSQQNRGNVELPSTQRLGRRHRHQQQNNHAGAEHHDGATNLNSVCIVALAFTLQT